MSNTEAHAEAHAEAHSEGQQHPLGIYIKIWALLFVLSACSYLVDYVGLQGYLRWSLIILFMLLKAGLIVAVFMHMLWERLALLYAILIPPILVMVFLFLIARKVWRGDFDTGKRGFFTSRKGNYETVEIMGLYWHFVDLVWVFIFAFFYLW